MNFVAGLALFLVSAVGLGTAAAAADCGTSGGYWSTFSNVTDYSESCGRIGTRAKMLDINYYWGAWSYSHNDTHTKNWYSQTFSQMNCGDC
jgi:hypothetical protein